MPPVRPHLPAARISVSSRLRRPDFRLFHLDRRGSRGRSGPGDRGGHPPVQGHHQRRRIQFAEMVMNSYLVKREASLVSRQQEFSEFLVSEIRFTSNEIRAPFQHAIFIRVNRSKRGTACACSAEHEDRTIHRIDDLTRVLHRLTIPQ